MQDFIKELDPRLLRSIITVIVFYLLRLMCGGIVHKYVEGVRSRIVWRQTINVSLLLVCIPLLIVIWFDEFRAVLTMVSLVAAALTIISKELLLNIIAYVVIIWRTVFTIGDRIQIGAVSGDLIAQGLMYFSVAEVGGWTRADGHTGRIIKIPNSKVLSESVANYTRGLSLIWEELSVDFSAESPPLELKKLGRQLIDDHAYKLTDADRQALANTPEEIIFSYAEPGVYLAPDENKTRLMLRFLCKFHKRRAVGQAILDRVMEETANNPELKLFRK